MSSWEGGTASDDTGADPEREDIAGMARVAAIAIDAAESWMVERLIADGHLPHLRALRERAARARTKNVVAYRSELPWTQFLTGRDAQENGYWSTETFDPATYTSYCHGAFTGRPFYAGQPRKVVAFDVPHLSLSEHVDGVQVTAWGAHGPQYPRASVPIGLLAEIDRRWGPHPAFDNDFDLGWFSDRYIDNLADALIAGAHTRLDIARWLLEEVEPDWELFLTSMSEVHSAAHHFWHGIDESHPLHGTPTTEHAKRRLIEVCSAVDAAIGRFVDELDGDVTVIVFALHGMQAADDLPSMVLLPELLHRWRFDEKLLRDIDRTPWERDGRPVIVPQSNDAWAVMTWLRDHFRSTPRDRVLHALRQVVPGDAYEFARRLSGRPATYPLGVLGEPIPAPLHLTPAEIREQKAHHKPIDWQPAAWYQPWWAKMPWFAIPTFTDAHIRVNLRGRERDGFVDLDDYDHVCDEAVAFLREIRDPRTGDDAVADVLRVRRYDPMDPTGPDSDLLVIWNRAYDAIEHPAVGMVGPVPFMRTGAHTSNGFFFATGDRVSPMDLGECDANHLTATVLELLGLDPDLATVGDSIASQILR